MVGLDYGRKICGVVGRGGDEFDVDVVVVRGFVVLRVFGGVFGVEVVFEVVMIGRWREWEGGDGVWSEFVWGREGEEWVVVEVCEWRGVVIRRE